MYMCTQVAVLHNDLATALDAHGQYSQAETHARTSLEIMSQAHVTDSGSDKEYFMRVHYNLGMILAHQGTILWDFVCNVLHTIVERTLSFDVYRHNYVLCFLLVRNIRHAMSGLQVPY